MRWPNAAEIHTAGDAGRASSLSVRSRLPPVASGCRRGDAERQHETALFEELVALAAVNGLHAGFIGT